MVITGITAQVSSVVECLCKCSVEEVSEIGPEPSLRPIMKDFLQHNNMNVFVNNRLKECLRKTLPEIINFLRGYDTHL